MITCCCSQLVIQVWRVTFSPDGNLLVAGCYDGHMYIYKLSNGRWAQVSVNEHHSERVLIFILILLLTTL